jgi:signal transduction histidine kinase
MPEHAGPKQLRRLLAAVMSIAYEPDVDVVLRQIVSAARDLVDARYAALGVLDPTRTHLAQFITDGLDDDAVAKLGNPPKGHGILGALITDPRPLRLPDLREHPDSFGFPPEHPPMTSFLGVPLYVRGEVFGNLYLTDKLNDGVFTDIDEELALSLASAAAIAIENARLHQQAAELSLLEDRERIGRDLHDTVLQQLFATGLSMQGTARLAQDRPDVVERIMQHIDDLDGTIRDIRSAIFDVEVTRLSGSSLRREILELVAASTRVLGFEPSVHLDGPIDAGVPSAVAQNLLAVLREALSNVARHARTHHVTVTIKVDGNLTLDVTDDGVGSASHRSGGSGGNGVRNIDRRARDLGGHGEVGAGPNGGTRVHWMVPLPTGIG